MANTGNSDTRKRIKSELSGRRAETIAVWFLRAKGYRVLARRFRCPAGEIDIVARHGKTLVFVEVKARCKHASALLAITPSQIKRIAGAAKIWLANTGENLDANCRFDIITVSAYLVPLHMRNAFGEDTYP